jgi:hypothetical protein
MEAPGSMVGLWAGLLAPWGMLMRVLDRLSRPGNGARVMFPPPVEVPQWSKPPRSPPSLTIITTRVLTKHEIVACAAAASRTHGEAVRHWPS